MTVTIPAMLRRPLVIALRLAALLLLASVVRLQAAPHLLAPNGAERFRVGSTTTIRWQGTAPADTVTIEYSTDAGASWNLITDRATGSEYVWRNIPRTPSERCLMRVSTRSGSGDSVLWLKRITEGFSIPNAVHFAEFSPDGSRVIGGEVSGNVTIWNSFTGEVITTIPVESRTNIPTPPGIPLVSCVRYTPDGRLFATISPLFNRYGSMVRIFDAATGAKLREWAQDEGAGPSSTGFCAFSPDGSKLLVTGLDGGAIYNVADGTVVARPAGYRAPFNVTSMVDADWRRDGGAIIGASIPVAGIIAPLLLHDPATGAVVRTYDFTPTSGVTCVRFTPDGLRFVSVSRDSVIRIWDAATGRVLSSLQEPGRLPNWVTVSHDGATFAVAGQDGDRLNWKLKLHDASNGTIIRTIGAIGNGMQNADFAPDDARALVSCIDGVRIFRARESTAGESDVSDALWAIYLSDGATVTISAPLAAARQGEQVAIPITIDAPEEAIGAGATRIDVSLRYDATLLDPLPGAERGTIDQGTRTIRLSLPLASSTDTVLATLGFRAALGDDSTTLLELVDPVTDVSTVAVAKRDGLFRMLDLCEQGGTRLLNPNGKAALRIVAAPRPMAYVEVEARTIERGETTVTLVDLNGRVIRECLRSDSPPELWRERIDLEDVASGRYLLVLRTPTIVESMPLEVTR